MTDRRAWVFGEQHLAPDAVVALVDGELSAGAQDRASAHLARCPFCAAEVTAQRQASRAVRGANAPGVSSGLLAALMAIPQEAELPLGPDGLAVTADGQLVAVLKPEQARRAGLLGDHSLGEHGLGRSTLLADGEPLSGETAEFGVARRAGGRRGAGLVVSGLVLGALALSFPVAAPQPRAPHPGPNAGIGSPLRGGRPDLVAPANEVLPVDSAVSAPSAPAASTAPPVPTSGPPGVAAERTVVTPVSVSALPAAPARSR